MGRRRSNSIEAYSESETTGRGRGYGQKYQPWLKTSDVTNSNGCRTRMFSLKCERVVHLLSHAEAQVFLSLDWLPGVVEIYEQYPLNPNVSVKVAEDLGFKHPGYARKDVYVMTSDFYVRHKDSNGFWYEAIQVKSSRKDTESKRSQEKLAIEQEYWKREGINWRLIYASDMNPVFLQNLQTLAPYRNTRYSSNTLDCFKDYFLRAQETFPEVDSTQLAEAELSFAGDIKATAWDVIVALAGKQQITFPINNKDLFSCTLQDFRPCHVSKE